MNKQKHKSSTPPANGSGSLMGAGLLAAFAASICCITPVLAFVAGISGFASAFSWLEPLRPYLIGLTVFVLGFAWYRQLKPKQSAVACGCESDKPSFWKSKKFLGIVTVMAAFLLAFPYFSGSFFPEPGHSTLITDEKNIIEATLTIEGMTCTGCEHHVNNTLVQQQGVIEAKTSYKEGTAIVKFDNSLTNINDLSIAVVEETGYKVVGHQFMNDDVLNNKYW